MTTIRYGGNDSIDGSPGQGPGGKTVNFTHPRELRGIYPTPPLQPLASYATELATFQTHLTALAAATDGGERRRLIMEAQGLLQSNHMQALPANAPGGAPAAAVKDAYKNFIFPNGGGYFGGALSSWMP